MTFKHYDLRNKYIWSLILAVIWVLFPFSGFTIPFSVAPGYASAPEIERKPALLIDPLIPGGIPWEDESEIERRQYPERYPPAILLPDLLTLPPSDLHLVLDHEARRKFVRFSNTIWNRGPGVLELFGEFNQVSETVRVTQNIYREDDTWLASTAGEFEFHPIHNHWHWDGFSLYEVWSVSPEGKLDHLLASSDKVGYCVRDIAPNSDAHSDENLASDPSYNSCYWARQGLSVDWTDTYRAHISGQIVDISHLPDGVYALKSTVDPKNIIIEERDANNSALVYFSIQENRLNVLGARITPIKPRLKFE